MLYGPEMVDMNGHNPVACGVVAVGLCYAMLRWLPTHLSLILILFGCAPSEGPVVTYPLPSSAASTRGLVHASVGAVLVCTSSLPHAG